MTDVLKVVKRDLRGTKRNRRLRKTGMTPAVLYGHGEENVSLSISTAEINAAIRHGSQLVSLTGDLSEDALIRDVQWDAFGLEVMHIDLTRVNKSEVVEVHVPVEMRGEAPGTHNAGVVEQPLHELHISCQVANLPEKLEVNINHLELNESIFAKDVKLPSGATLLTGPDEVVVHCIEASSEAEEEGEAGAPSEPELIGGKHDEEESSEN